MQILLSKKNDLSLWIRCDRNLQSIDFVGNMNLTS